MASALDDEDLALSINPSHTSRRNSTRGPESYGAEPPPPVSTPERQEQAQIAQRATQRLGQYSILKTLGEGSFGKVKLAVHQVTGQKVALKIISRRKLVARDMAGRIEREIQYLQLLRHPHIIKLYTVITTPAEIIMVLEYAGSELFNYIVDNGKMHEDKARGFFQQIVCAVEYCHRHKIVHRDLKPENLLLDDNLHVKIADFGLSNIMTDGNFLKTSCGSPNYAAPEVISGKLYAGPEVDVWSCGVILYVLLVGRLPFDDEYIPALFKKIAQGTYHVPHYVTKPAAHLIKKMLQISPVNRITVQEIRQDPWFMKDLPSYLQPPVEEFLDTGVDPNKAIDPRNLAPNKSATDQQRIHESVIGKLGKTMGYGRDDVQQALAIDEPNAIKDAYLIVRENQVMHDTPSFAKDPNLQEFLVGSPPNPVSSPMTAQSFGTSTLAESVQRGAPPPEKPRSSFSSKSPAGADGRTLVTTLGVLPSSLPDYHSAFMKGQPEGGSETDVQSRKLEAEGKPASVQDLKPHSKSAGLARTDKPEGLTPVHPPHKKSRPTKWQFGIRSRNQPAEAMLAIYKALRAMGAEWEIPESRKSGRHHSGDVSPRQNGSDRSDDDGSDDDDDEERRSYNNSNDSSKRFSTGSSSYRGRRRSRSRGRETPGEWNDWGYSVPQDPWIITARFRKDNMYPPGAIHPSSNHSSRVDLHDTSASGKGSDANLNRSRRSSTLSSNASNPPNTTSPPNTVAQTDNPGHTGPAPPPQSQQQPSLSRTSSGNQAGASGRSSSTRTLDSHGPGSLNADSSAYVFMTIQLYSIEKEFYLVDFKCAGYERLVRRMVKEVESFSSSGGSRSRGSVGPPSRQGSRYGDEQFPISEDEEAVMEQPAQPSQQQQRGHGSDGNDLQRFQSTDNVGGGGSNSNMNTSGRSSALRWREELVGTGRAFEEKDVSSPYPFLDIANRLIIQLAEAE